MGISIFDLKPNNSVFRPIRRRNADGFVGPPEPPAKTESSFDWNNLVSTLGSSISSIFNGLTGVKQAETLSNQQRYSNNNTNSILWIGIAVVAVIVVVIIMSTRKK